MACLAEIATRVYAKELQLQTSFSSRAKFCYNHLTSRYRLCKIVLHLHGCRRGVDELAPSLCQRTRMRSLMQFSI